MNTLTIFTTKIRAVALASLCLALSACGGGGSSDSAPSATPPVSNLPAPQLPGTGTNPSPNPTPITEPSPAPAPGPIDPIPVPPDLSIVPPPGTVIEPMVPTVPVPPSPEPGPVPEEPKAPPIVVNPPVTVELPSGAVWCQPSICPSYPVNGSVTNSSGSLNPTEAKGYLIMTNEPSVGDDQYPELRNIPRLVLPPEWVTIGEAPIVTDHK